MGRWLVVSSHDERYDFNLGVTTFTGTVNEFEEGYGINVDRKNRKCIDGVYYYHTSKRSDTFCNNIDEDVWDELKGKLDVVNFALTILIPMDKLNGDLMVQHPMVFRNVKFGFLDIKLNRDFK